jgi:hypothetical protein
MGPNPFQTMPPRFSLAIEPSYSYALGAKLYKLLICALPFAADPTDGRSGVSISFLGEGRGG